jgi:P27 family predicted phage terminase small subunit
MKRGPRPQPAAVKRAKGNPGRRPIGEAPQVEEQPDGIHPPDWLKDEGLGIWNRLAPQLASMNILAKIDAWTFARYCRNFARWLSMNERLDDVGEIYTVTTESGEVRRNDPSYVIADRLERQLIAAEANFGLNPAERQRLYAAKIAAGAQGRLPLDPPPVAPTKDAPAPAGVRGDASPVGLLN